MTAQCLESLLQMAENSFRIVVIDNGSRDGSVEYLRPKFPQVDFIENSRNVGFAAGCNIGVRRALEENSEFVLLVNNDTIVDPAMLSNLLSVAAEYPRAGIVSPKIFYFDRPELLWWAGGHYSLWTGVPSHIGRKKVDNGAYDDLSTIDWATGCVMLMRCSALRDVGLFDERIFGNGEDLDLSLRMRLAGWEIRYAPLSKLWHKEGIDYRRNVGEHVRKFTNTRNILLVMHKHSRWAHRLIFWPCFTFWYLPLTILKCLSKGDGPSAIAAVAGVRAYFSMLKNPETQVLPPELARSSESN